MPAITHDVATPSLLSCSPVFSFYEMRVPAKMVINPCFMALGGGQWEYQKPKITAVMSTPCWDKGYDWNAAYAAAKSRYKRPWWM
jgi:hypothetical protein